MQSKQAGLVLVVVALAVSAAVPVTAGAAESCVYQGLITSDSKDRSGPKKRALDRRTKVEHSLLCLTNLHRAHNGLGLLKLDSRLAGAARSHSADMVARDYFDHFTPEGTSPSDRARAAGYPGGAGENIAANFTGTALSLFEQWGGSSGHNQNMLNPGYVTAGFGVATGMPGSSRGVTGTQMFASASGNRGYEGLDLYASSKRCARVKVARLNFLDGLVGKKGFDTRKLRRLNRKVKDRCRPLGPT